MARRTKEEAAATRDSILDAAEKLFVEQGVSRTTLQHIATQAGVTRGAIYWHFDDKGALFNAMMERVTLPFECALSSLGKSDATTVLADLRQYFIEIFRVTETNPQARRVLEIASLKVEFVSEMDAVRVRRRQSKGEMMEQVVERLKLAQAGGQIRADVDPQLLATGLWALMDGLIRNWMFEPTSFSLIDLGGNMIGTMLDGIRTR
ncbi:TetR family transcriptional regulator [Massilia litorea]|jgi:TetR/AcrR family acrAB operon transcriptional repressor|uniref:TetR family transcriptional regulator n=1 Tax=Massilia litorea TaxID=2769491 RepID=A0A7L9UAD3_9BURK|nr:TetR family transcriptional regulator [Massilia litorea]QOL51790.1 TetR family transcriptional regulator [Massilia litorea]